MKVGELRAALQDVDDDMEVFVRMDGSDMSYPDVGVLMYDVEAFNIEFAHDEEDTPGFIIDVATTGDEEG